ncbi:TMEM175 family protein [Pontimicrobium sp. SW4]|uniref:TMEM175 family protein n=1 Tax=Pontimicrobium sp. SW4 TaxID=3153519 RepID=A0AAU7BW70_9FLAO
MLKLNHSISRIEAFSDAVFAFSATLMVVSLGSGDSFLELKNNFKNFISFGVSFFVLIALWKLHYNYFRRNSYIDNLIITYNSILLFVVLYFVFPLKSMTSTLLRQVGISIEDLASLFVLYSLGFLLIFLCFSLMYKRAYKNSKTNNVSLLFYSRHFFIFVLVSIISIILAIFKIGVTFGLPGFVYAILGPLCYFHSVKFQAKYGNIQPNKL